MFYDSMIAKLIVHGRDRNDAIGKMREALALITALDCVKGEPVLFNVETLS